MKDMDILRSVVEALERDLRDARENEKPGGTSGEDRPDVGSRRGARESGR